MKKKLPNTFLESIFLYKKKKKKKKINHSTFHSLHTNYYLKY